MRIPLLLLGIIAGAGALSSKEKKAVTSWHNIRNDRPVLLRVEPRSNENHPVHLRVARQPMERPVILRLGLQPKEVEPMKDSPISSESSEEVKKIRPDKSAAFSSVMERLMSFRKQLQELRKSKSSEKEKKEFSDEESAFKIRTESQEIQEQAEKFAEERKKQKEAKSSSSEMMSPGPLMALSMMSGMLSGMRDQLGGPTEKKTESKSSMESPFAFMANLDEPSASKEVDPEPKFKAFSAEIKSPLAAMGPFGMMSTLLAPHGLLSSVTGVDSSEEKKGGLLDESSLEDIKDEVSKTVSDGAVKMMIANGAKEEGDPLTSSVGTFTEIIGSLFGKLASTIGTKMKADPMDRSSPFGIADLVGDSLMQLRGPHICVRELNSVKPHNSNCKNKTRSYSHNCRTYNQAVKCTTTKRNENTTQISVRIQECCEGYTTVGNIKATGCKKEAKLLSPVDFLIEEKACNCTHMKAEKLPKRSTLIVAEGGDQLITFPEMLNDYDLEDGQVLNSTEGQAYKIKVFDAGYTTIAVINCVMLKKTNVALTTGRGHVAERQIKPAVDTIFEILEKGGRFKKFLSLLSEEAIAAFKNKSASQTVLPFTDEAFANFPKSYQDQINNRIPCIASGIARGHIFQPATCSNDLKMESGHWPSRKIGGAELIETDLVAQNGVVHVVDDIIVKEDLESWDEKLKSLSPELEEKLRGKIEPGQPVTIFIPKSMISRDGDSDEDMENVEGSGAGSPMSEEAALDLVIPWFLPSIKALPNSLTTMGNTTIFAGNFQDPSSRSSSRLARKRKILPTVGQPQIGCSRIISEPRSEKDRVGACGVSIYFLDKPIPHITHSIESLLKSRNELKKFSGLMESYLANDTLPRRAMTLFAPVDDAFSVNTLKKLNANPEKMATFVRCHLVSKPLCEHDFHSESIRPETVSNKNGEHLKYSLHRGKDLFVEDSRILETIIVSNGIVHLIDSSIEKTPEALPPVVADIHRNIFDSI